MSLLLASGHHNASQYPLGKVGVEAYIVEGRVNAIMASEAILHDLAIRASQSKKGRKEFTTQVKKLLSRG